MDTIIGCKFEGGTVIAADQSNCRSILVYQHDVDKIKVLNESCILAAAGPQSDTTEFGEYVAKNMKLYQLSHEHALTPKATAHFVRNTLAQAMRKGPYQANVLLGGYDAKEGGSLYYMDYLGSMAKVNYGCQGYASNFCLSIFDREWKEGLTKEEAVTIIEHCVNELKTRFMISQPNFIVKVVDSDGCAVVRSGAMGQLSMSATTSPEAAAAAAVGA